MPVGIGSTVETIRSTVDPADLLKLDGSSVRQLSEAEVHIAAEITRKRLSSTTDILRFNFISLKEPSKGSPPDESRRAEVVVIAPTLCKVYELLICLSTESIETFIELDKHLQPVLTPADCFLAEEIVLKSEEVADHIAKRCGVGREQIRQRLVCDPWSVHVATQEFEPLHWRKDGGELPTRLVQTFLYLRDDANDNHYAHPVDVLPVVDLFAEKVVHISMQGQAPAIPADSVNYHRDKVASNTYLQAVWRSDLLAPLNIIQPDGPSFTVSGNNVSWQKWNLTVGFNYREGLVLHDLKFDSRPVITRASLVEMAVPYGDPSEPFTRKCAFDVGDYGLGYCANSLELGCDCLGHIHYFDGVLSDADGKPYTVPKVICMHEEDAGLLWKHVEYRNGHSEARRARRLVISFIATVVNYEYLFYYYLHQDGTFDFEIKLSGELSTNLLSEGETTASEYGTMVAPGVNAQVHQHMFCMRLHMNVDGPRNSVYEVDVQAERPGPSNRYGNAFKATKKLLATEKEAQRNLSPAKARTWRIENPNKENPISKLPVAYKLVPFTKGPAQPTLLTSDDCAVTKRGVFATKSLWVTPYCERERYPAGDYTVQSSGGQGLGLWTEANRSVQDQDIVLWHAFGVVHVPRPEDFPVMPCESTGFTLKPDGFFAGNPTIDLPPEVDRASACCK